MTQGIESYFNRATRYYKEGKYEEAIANYDKAIELQPEDADAWFNKGTNSIMIMIERQSMGKPKVRLCYCIYQNSQEISSIEYL